MLLWGIQQAGVTPRQWPQELDSENEEAFRGTGSILEALKHHCIQSDFPPCFTTRTLTDAMNITAAWACHWLAHEEHHPRLGTASSPSPGSYLLSELGLSLSAAQSFHGENEEHWLKYHL